MTTEPDTIAFCRVPGGSQVAYAAMGAGRPLVMVPGGLCHLLQSYEHPAASTARAKLAARRRFIWYDRLGCGLSDRDGFDLSLDNDVDQLETVLDAAGVEQADLIGYSLGAPAAAVFAARHPERVGRLVFPASFARGASVYADAEFDVLTSMIRRSWGLASRALGASLVPNASSEDLRWFSRFQTAACTAEVAIEVLEHMRTIDVSDVLASVRAPSLVIHNRHDPAVPFAAGRELAAGIPGARLHVLEGNEHDPFIRDSGQIVETVLAFVDGRPIEPAGSRGPTASAGQVGGSLPNGMGTPVGTLTDRECDILRLIAQGESNKQIAVTLDVAIATVERHITNLYRKIGARGRADAVMAAIALGVVSPPGPPTGFP